LTHFFDEARHIWQTYVPRVGQADTVQGELLRAVEKLRDEAIRNGNGNWDESFDILLLYLEERLLDPTVYSDKAIADTRKILARLHAYENPLMDDEPYDELGDRVVEYFRRRGSQPNALNPRLRR
jgi:hypothetical protein